MISRLSFCTALSLSLLSSTVLAEKISRTFNASPDGTLTLRTEAGSVGVITHAENTINVEIDIDERNDGEFSVEFNNKDDGLTIEGRRKGRRNSGSHRVHYQITLPSQYNIEIDTAGGGIHIQELSGQVKARTSGGKITLDEVVGNTDIKTSGGPLDLTDVRGRITGHTSGGSINLELHDQPENLIKLHTSAGSITAKFPENSRIDLEANTSGGRVSSEWQVNGSISTQQIEGKINGGGPKIDLKTSGGSINVEKISFFH